MIKPLKIIENGLEKIDKNFEMLEPSNNPLSKRDYLLSEPVRLTWLGDCPTGGTPFLKTSF